MWPEWEITKRQETNELSLRVSLFSRPPVQSSQRRRHWSGSEASYNTYSSRGTYGYESERFEAAKMMKSGPRSGLSVDSDDDDYR